VLRRGQGDEEGGGSVEGVGREVPRGLNWEWGMKTAGTFGRSARRENLCRRYLFLGLGAKSYIQIWAEAKMSQPLVLLLRNFDQIYLQQQGAALRLHRSGTGEIVVKSSKDLHVES
jgi:hypothetical protein